MYNEEEIAQNLLNAPLSLGWMDLEHKYLGCNIECCALFGLPPQEILGKTIFDIAKNRDFLMPLAEEIYMIENTVMNEKISKFQLKYTFSLTDKKNLRQLVARVPLLDLRQNILGLAAAGILEREYNNQLKVELSNLNPNQFIFQIHPTINLKWSEMLNMLPAGIWWIDREHKYRGANMSYCRSINKKLFLSELVGKTIIDVGKMSNWPEYKSKNIRDLDESLMSMNHIGYNVENIIPQGKDVSSIRQIIAKKPILDKNGKVNGLMCVAVYNGLFGEKSEW